MANKSSNESRRKFLKVVPVAMAGAVAGKALAQGAQANGPITADDIKAAEALDGVKFTSEEEAVAARGANANLNSFNRMRQITIPQDTEPAYVFKPSLPGKEPKGPATPGAPIKFTKPAMTLKRPQNLEDVAFWPVTKLAALVERRLVTSTELTNMYLARLKRYQPTLNFYVNLTEELALKQAAEADREIKAGKYRGPLHGLPWGAKDLFATKGIKTTWGGEPYVDQIIDYDATIVERLRDAGAVLVAKLTLGALAQGDVWFGGQTKNPWNPQTGSSGSSAGPGSATAAGCVAFGIGTETRGSILSPSSVNGLVGLRPTYGRVSRYGAMALSTTMDKIGPLCRYVEDAVLVFNAIYGPDKRDGSVADAAFHWAPDTPLAGLKIAYVKTAFDNAGQGRGGGGGRPGGAPGAAGGGAPGAAGGGAAGAPGAPGGGRGRGPQLTPEQQAALAAETKKVYDDVLETYRKLGAKLEPVDVPAELNQITGAIGFILDVESSASFDDATRSGDINQLLNPNGSRSSWPNTFRQARFVPAVEYIRAMRARTILMRQADDFFSKYDAVLEPGTGGTLAMTNLTGHPAMALKCGFTNTPGYANGQPRVLMLTGRLYDEGTIARVALAYEQATEWKDRNPSLSS
ncbi:MAG TPA: amidase [Vicinamibacterales bacterium]|nr:amidase [Vicinamibacterales bacterium]